MHGIGLGGVCVGKVPLLVASERDSIIRFVTGLSPATVVIDLEPLVAAWGSDPADVVARALSLSEIIAGAAPRLSALIFTTNARMSLPKTLEGSRLAVKFKGSACKPWRFSYLAGTPKPVIVIGDQIITDGLLALRLQATFIHWQEGGRKPWWPRVQIVIGKAFAWSVFALHRAADANDAGTIG